MNIKKLKAVLCQRGCIHTETFGVRWKCPNTGEGLGVGDDEDDDDDENASP